MARMSGSAPSYSVTSAGVNPAEDRAHRIRMYFIAMTLRVVCVVSLFWVQGWWVLVPVLGAIFFPWFAVMIGNAVAYGGEQKLDAPEPRQLTGGTLPVDEDDAADHSNLLIVDVDPVRRASDFEAEAGNNPESHARSQEGFRE